MRRSGSAQTASPMGKEKTGCSIDILIGKVSVPQQLFSPFLKQPCVYT